MKQILLSIVVFLSFFLISCELKDTETEKEKCEKRQREFTILGIAQCGLTNTPGSAAYNLCVDIGLISFMDNIAQCDK
jgi:hypothetical protein